jgi:predicted PurR-regulated permease PerM
MKRPIVIVCVVVAIAAVLTGFYLVLANTEDDVVVEQLPQGYSQEEIDYIENYPLVPDKEERTRNLQQQEDILEEGNPEKSFVALKDLATIAIQTGDYAAAEKYYTQARELIPKDEFYEGSYDQFTHWIESSKAAQE